MLSSLSLTSLTDASGRGDGPLPVAWQRPPGGRLVCAPGELHLWRHALASSPGGSDGNDEERGAAPWPLLSTDERERAARFHFARDRNNYVAARGGLRLILSRYTGLAPAELTFSYGAQGKPALVRTGTAPGLAFNLAHSGAYAVYAVGNARRVGIDVERIRPEVCTDELAAATFSPRELGALRALAATERPDRFFTLWTCKEAYVKARGEGLSIPLDSFDVVFGTGGGVRLDAGAGAEGEPWHLRAFRLSDGYPAALVHDGDRATCRFYDL